MGTIADTIRAAARNVARQRFGTLVHWGYGTGWGAKEIAIDAWHHAVYAVATGLVYERLDGRAA